ncbi:general stress protein [Paenibacillus tritici]|uniref:General stress protein n=1 Tax=Paenibacillus tritici TaxID=1873425 RepID=A0ABX2DRQ6_9BACL|nr:general stress protein [Paenibacillus tritici]
MNKKIVGVFHTEHEASRAIEDLKAHGFLTEDISVIARNRRDAEAINEETGTKAPEGLASGAATGGILGGVTGLLAGIGALAIPGIGPIIAAGPIAATLTGVAVGAGTGGLVGGLIGLGIPEDEAASYDNDVDEGRILVMVDADNKRESEVYSVFRNHNSANADRYMTDTSAAGDAPRDSVTDAVDAAFNGSGLEGRHDTGLDTMNSATEHDLPERRAVEDMNRPGMTGDLYSGTRNGIDKTPDHTADRRLADLEEKQAQNAARNEGARAGQSREGGRL